jgi:hypothetical protein
LHGLSASVLSQPANLSVALSLTNTSVSGQALVPLTFSVRPSDLSQLQGLVTIQVNSAEGPVAQASLFVTIAPLRSVLATFPNTLYSAMPIGGQQRVQFTLANLGGVTTGPVTISVPNLPWLSVATTNPFAGMSPGQSNTITLLLTPAADLPLGPYLVYRFTETGTYS